MQNKSNSKIREATIDDIISEIESKSSTGNYIYRGEGKVHEKVSSALYREYAGINIEEFDLMYAQREMLKTARNHIGESPVGFLEDFIDIMNRNKMPMDYAEKSMTDRSQNTLQSMPQKLSDGLLQMLLNAKFLLSFSIMVVKLI